MMIQIRDHAEKPQEASGGSPAMTCEEFQEQLSTLMGSDIREHEHLRSCVRCNALLDELEYISEIAQGLLPTYEPSDKVLEKLRKSIHETDGGETPPNGLPPESQR
jgi:hypothetical protein